MGVFLLNKGGNVPPRYILAKTIILRGIEKSFQDKVKSVLCTSRDLSSFTWSLLITVSADYVFPA